MRTMENDSQVVNRRRVLESVPHKNDDFHAIVIFCESVRKLLTHARAWRACARLRLSQFHEPILHSGISS